MKISIKEQVNNIPSVLQALKVMRSKKIEVGILGNQELAEKARGNEFGTISKLGNEHIPARPFLRPTFDDPKVQRKLMELARGFVSEGVDPYDVLEKVGAMMQSEIQAKIRSNIKPANAPSTIKRKRSRRTLIDKGRMIQAITYKVSNAS